MLALAAAPGYMQLPADTILYQAAADGYVELCTLPSTYYVIPLAEEKNGYIAVSWLDINGFIKSDAAESVDYEPLTPHFDRKLTADNDLNPVNIRSAPDHTADNVIGSLPHGKTAAVYGERQGSSLIPQVGGLWYYIRYSDGETSYTGYVYSAQVKADAYVPNSGERVAPSVTEPIETAPGNMPTAAKAALIAALCIPAVFIVLLIFRPGSKPRTPRGL